MAEAWPERAGDPHADRMNSIAKYVVSRSLDADDVSSRWANSRLVGGEDPVGAIRELKDSDGDAGIQVWGSSSIARLVIENDLVDEYVLLLEPILLGAGKTIFPSDGRARPLELDSVTPSGTGVLVCRYRPAAG